MNKKTEAFHNNQKNSALERVTSLEGLMQLLLVLILSIIPLIVQLYVVPENQELSSIWNKISQGDFYSYYKSKWLIILTTILMFLMIFHWVGSGRLKTVKSSKLSFSRSKQQNKHQNIHHNIQKYIQQYILIGLMAGCVILSTLISEYKYTAIWGIPERYEGAIVWGTYFVLFLMSMTIRQNAKWLKVISVCLLFSASVIGCIGILQFFELDIFQTQFGSELLQLFSNSDKNFKILHRGDGASAVANGIYSTLYNSNTLGMYMSMVFLFSFVEIFFVQKVKSRILLSCISMVLFVNLIGSFSRGAFLAAVITMIVIIFLLIWTRYGNIKLIFGLLISYFLLFGGMDLYSSSEISSRLFGINSIEQKHKEDFQIDKIKEFNMKGHTLTLTGTKSQLIVRVDEMGLNFYDENNSKLTLSKENDKGLYTFKENNYENYKITVSDNLLKIQKGKSYLYFVILEDGFHFLNSDGELVDLGTDIKSFGFIGFERLGSARGYIWSRTLPLLKESFLFGFGPDTFSLYFPQDDYKGKLKFMYDAYVYVDKPHNMYLQMSINTGVISLVFFLLLILSYFIRCFSTIKRIKGTTVVEDSKINITRNDDVFIDRSFLFATFALILSYLIAGMFTDTTVSVTPVFWIMLGLSFQKLQQINAQS